MAPKKEARTSITLKEQSNHSKSGKQTEMLLQRAKASECCQGKIDCSMSSTSSAVKNAKNAEETPFTYNSTDKKGPKTRIIIKYDVGFNNVIYLRGKGAS
jgi:hypothetical protein